MSSHEPTALDAEIIDEYTLLSLPELSRLCAVETRTIVELVEEGVLVVGGAERAESAERAEITEWRFPGTALRRTRTALRLQRDLEINLAGVALALQLMEEIEFLRRELKVLR